MSLRRSVSAHRSAAAVGGAVLLAALTVSGSAAAPALHADAAKTAVAAAPAALPSITKPRVTIASTASLVSAGSVFHVDIGYTCTAKSSTSINLEGHQSLNDGFVANGYGFSRVAPVCDGKKHSVRITVVPSGERGFMRGPAYAITDFFSCPPKSQACEPTTLERTIAVR